MAMVVARVCTRRLGIHDGQLRDCKLESVAAGGARHDRGTDVLGGVLGVVVFVLSAVIRQRRLPPWAQVVLTLGGIFAGALGVFVIEDHTHGYIPPEHLYEPERSIDLPNSDLTLTWAYGELVSDACVWLDLQRGDGLFATHRYRQCGPYETSPPTLEGNVVRFAMEPSFADSPEICRYVAVGDDLRPTPGSHPGCALDWSN